jgi:hypothetical protein
MRSRARRFSLGILAAAVIFSFAPKATAQCLCNRLAPVQVTCNDPDTGCRQTIVVNAIGRFDFSSCWSIASVSPAYVCCGQGYDRYEYWNVCKISGAHQQELPPLQEKSPYWSKNYYVPDCKGEYQAVL